MLDITKSMKACRTPECSGSAWAAKGMAYCTACHNAPLKFVGNKFNFGTPKNPYQFVPNPICAMPGCSEYAPKDLGFSFCTTHRRPAPKK